MCPGKYRLHLRRRLGFGCRRMTGVRARCRVLRLLLTRPRLSHFRRTCGRFLHPGSRRRCRFQNLFRGRLEAHGLGFRPREDSGGARNQRAARELSPEELARIALSPCRPPPRAWVSFGCRGYAVGGRRQGMLQEVSVRVKLHLVLPLARCKLCSARVQLCQRVQRIHDRRSGHSRPAANGGLSPALLFCSTFSCFSLARALVRLVRGQGGEVRILFQQHRVITARERYQSVGI
mmetsp:Transcript_15275/g.37947  ORF Transcript_15275/g.37947 Transcript_15275/m.37947 type:complete len:234 (-) Transcript_15275:1051-1752(-)